MSSHLEHLRKLRDAKSRDTTLDLVVPGYDGDLAVRYKPLPEKRINQLGDKLGKNATGVKVGEQLIVDACEQLLVRENDELVPLVDDEGPVTFNAGLPEIFGFETKSARETVKEIFSPNGTTPFAVVAHGTALVAWMQGKRDEIDEALLGE